jgi:hypothetical protein
VQVANDRIQWRLWNVSSCEDWSQTEYWIF